MKQATITIDVEHGENNDVEEVEITGEFEEDLCIAHILWDKNIYGNEENGLIDEYIDNHKNRIVEKLTDKFKESLIPQY